MSHTFDLKEKVPVFQNKKYEYRPQTRALANSCRAPKFELKIESACMVQA
jgi:hypothetical protein